ncbi:MAG TPA: hypothetical protein PK358_06055 [Spirochaetota bacterium]|nr:hypothetical protein [Spirochaetota bacterium]HPJ34380.1 hypothetical protein [Spirochaetota bacterium]
MNCKSTLLRIIRTPLFSIVLAIMFLYFDYITGVEIQFPVLFILPVLLITWYNNLYWGIALSVFLPLSSVYYICAWKTHPPAFIAINVIIRMAIILFIAYLLSLVKKQQQELSERINNLEKFLPICSFCKKIRDEENNWHSIESYITGKTKTEFSHGVCPECAEKHYGKYLKK